MRIRIFAALLALLLVVSGCNKPQDDASKAPSNETTITTTKINQTNGITNVVDSTSTTTLITTEMLPPLTSTSVDAHNSTTVTNSINTEVDSTTPHNSLSNDTSTSSAPLSTTTQSQSSTVKFKATLRENINQKPMSGVTVTVYADATSKPLGSGVTDRNGVAYIEILRSSSYKVILSNLPDGYEATNPYSFSTNTVNITIKKSAVYNEKDHSGAQYAPGDVMTDFVLTDTDGNIHRLSDLLQEKQLVILDFWYVNCDPCKTEFPIFESALKRYGDKVTLLAIDPFDSSRAISDLRKKLNANSKTAISFPMMQDSCNLTAGFSATTFPTTVFINSDGIILDIHKDAYPTESALFAAIERYLH